MNRRFPLLSVVSYLMRFIGWLFLLLALLLWLLVIRNYFTAGLQPVDVAPAAFATVFALFLVAAGESIEVLFSIEDNTRAAAEHLYRLAREKITPKT